MRSLTLLVATASAAIALPTGLHAAPDARWVKAAITANMSYDQFVRELVTAERKRAK